MGESRTRARALNELLKLLPETRAAIGDPVVRGVMSEALVNEVFDLAWDHQFDEDRSQVSRQFRDVVREAIEGLTTEG